MTPTCVGTTDYVPDLPIHLSVDPHVRGDDDAADNAIELMFG